MKKRSIIFLICAMLISVCVGCGSENNITNTESATPEQTTEPIATPEVTEEPTEPPHEHTYTESVTKEATCTEAGEKTFACECGDTYTEAVNPIGHIFENYASNNDATYTADGTETAKCNTCDLTDTRTAEGSKLEYTYTEINATMYATQTVNVRNLPSTDGEKIGSLSTNQEITVLGQCNETGWYKFELDGQTAFVSNSYLIDTPIEVAQNDGGTVTPAPNTSLPNFPYPLHTWTQQTSAEGCPILIIYSTYSSIGEIRYGTPSPTPDIFRTEGELGLLWTTVSAYADTHGYGFHFLYPVTKVGDYAEGTIYQCIAGAHYSTTPEGCPNFGTGICKPGTID